MPRSHDINTSKTIIHAGTKEGRAALQPLGRSVKVTGQAKELMEDFRLEACAFGQASEAVEVERRWVNMQMRFHELAEYIGTLESQHSPYARDALMQF